MARKIDHEARKRAIVARAMHLFSQVGYDNVSLIMIAAASGVARTVLYRYFCSKREVLDAAILETTRHIMDDCRGVLAGRRPVADKLEAICFATVDTLFDKRQFLVAVYDFVIAMVRTGADMSGKIYEFTSGIRETFVRLIDEGKSRKEFAADVDTVRTADTLYSFFESFTMRLIMRTENGPEAAKARFQDMIASIARKG